MEGPGKLRRTPAARQGSGEGATLQGGVLDHAIAALISSVPVASPRAELELLAVAYSALDSPSPLRYAIASRRSLTELIRPDVDLDELSRLSATGARLAATAREWLRQAERRRLLLRDSLQPAEMASRPFRASFALTEPPTTRELALLNATAGSDSSIYIPSWIPRSELGALADPLLCSGWSPPEQSAKTATPDRQLLRFSEAWEEAAWIVAAAKEEILGVGVPPSQIAIVLSDAGEYLDKIRLHAAACGLQLAGEHRALPLFRRRIQDLVEFTLFGRILGSPAATRHAREALKARSTPRELDADGWIQFTFDALQRLMPAGEETAASESLLLEELITTLNATFRDGTQRLAREAFLTTLPAIAATVEPPPATGGVAVLPVGFLAEGAYQTILLAGAGSGLLPTPLRDDATIPLALRDRISGLRSSRDLVARAWNRAFSVVHAPSMRMVATFSSSRSDHPSRLLDRLELAPEAPPKRFAASHADYALLGSGPLRAAVTDGVRIERQRLFSAEFGPFAGDVGEPVELGRLSPTSINAIGQCGYKWLTHWVFRIDRRDPESFEPTPAEMGLLAHSVLEEAIKLEEAPDRRALAEIIDRRSARLRWAPSWPLLRHDLVEDLTAIMSLEGFERPAEMAVEVGLQGSIGAFELFGRLDRLDTLPDGRYRIIDYKYSSEAPKGIKDEDGRATVDVQLAIYSSLVEQNRGAVAEAQYLLVKARRFKTPKVRPETLSAALDRVQQAASAGHLRVQPDLDRVACQWCAAVFACRIGPHVDGKEAG